MKAEIKKQVEYPANIEYICSSYPPQSGYISIKKEDTTYELINIGQGKSWEVSIPPNKACVDGWGAGECKTQFLEPDLIMIDDLTYTTYIKLV